MRDYLIFLLLLMVAPAADFAADTPQLPRIDDFSVSLFQQLQGHPGNLVFSPLSARTALAMASSGAQGKTARQINDALGTPITQPAIGMDQIQLANALWLQQDFTPNNSFRDAISERFRAELHSVDFRSDPNGAGQKINQWVADKTANKIPSLFADGSLKTTDQLVIVNTIYLKVMWQKQFEKNATSDGPFKSTVSGKPIDVPTMHGLIPTRYFANDELEMISLPYKGSDLSMTIVLPRKVDGLVDLEKTVTAANLDDWLSQEKRSRIDLSLPKWKSATSLDLVPALQAIGVRTAFTEQADFSGISANTHLHIGKIVQKAMIDVDETGTEAAAATGIEMQTLAAAPHEPITVNVDHPFLFFIQAHPQSGSEQGKSGTLLFLGRVTDPRET